METSHPPEKNPEPTVSDLLENVNTLITKFPDNEEVFQRIINTLQNLQLSEDARIRMVQKSLNLTMQIINGQKRRKEIIGKN